MYGLTREMSSKLERCMVTRETYTPLELKTKPNQHLSSNKNPDHLDISRVIENKLNQVIKSDQAPLERSICPTHSGPPAPNGAKIIFLSMVHLYFYECIYCISFSPIARHTLDPRPLMGLSNQTKRLSSYRNRPSVSRVIKMPDTLWTPGP